MQEVPAERMIANCSIVSTKLLFIVTGNKFKLQTRYIVTFNIHDLSKIVLNQSKAESSLYIIPTLY